MRRSKSIVLSIFLSAALFCAGCSSSQVTPDETRETELPVSSGVQITSRYTAALHSLPTTSRGRVLDEIPAGTVLDVVSADTYWTRVLYQGQSGYIYNEMIAKEEQDPVVEVTDAPEIITDNKPWIHALSQAELDTIAGTYDGTVKGYGAPVAGLNEEGYNRYAVDLDERLSGFNTRFFGDKNSKTIYLTFSCGWENAPNTATILDTLAKYGIKATFYVTHAYAESSEDLVWRMIKEGHEIGSHSYAHPNEGLPSLPLAQQMQDTMDMQNYMVSAFGYTMSKYNFNSSYWSEQSVALLTQMGYEVCFFSFNYFDYDVSQPTAAEDVLSLMKQALHPGVIYYLHPVSVGNTQALPEFIEQALAAGYTFSLLP